MIRDTLVLIGYYEGKLIGVGGMPKNFQGTLNKHHDRRRQRYQTLFRYKGRQASHGVNVWAKRQTSIYGKIYMKIIVRRKS